MRAAVVLSLVASACRFEPGSFSGDGNTVHDDARRDGVSDGDVDSTMATTDADSCWSVAALSITVCLAAPLSGAIDVTSDATVDTDETGTGATECKTLGPGSSDVCAVAGNTFRIGPSTTLD